MAWPRGSEPGPCGRCKCTKARWPGQKKAEPVQAVEPGPVVEAKAETIGDRLVKIYERKGR